MVIDDFGLHPGINQAAEELAAQGRVHAVGALVGAPAWQAGTPLLRRLDAQRLDIGLHFDLTHAPLLRSSWRPLGSLIMAAYAGRLDRTALEWEIHAQLDAFESALGHAPAFVDGHQHVHQLPGVREALVAELEQRYRAHERPWLRSACRSGGSLKARVVRALGANALGTLARRNGFDQNRSLLGVYDFRGGATRYLELLSGWLSRATDGDLLMCHAGIGLPGTERLAEARAAEFSVLSGLPFARMLQSRRIVLRPMSRILRGDGA